MLAAKVILLATVAAMLASTQVAAFVSATAKVLETSTSDLAQTAEFKSPSTTTAETVDSKTHPTTIAEVIKTTTDSLMLFGFDCSFEHGLCGWRSHSGASMDWILHGGVTSTKDTGPNSDHTTGTSSGKYLYIEASSPNTIGDFATLYYRFPKPLTSGCFSMYYHMYGSSIGTLKVTGQDVNGKKEDLWSMTNDQGTIWRYMQTSLAKPITQISITGIRGSSFRGDIAIDDIVYREGYCKGPQSQINCTFEHGLCGWLQDTNDNFNWQSRQGKTSSARTGPQGDHTSGQGHYLYIEASSPRRQNDIANLHYYLENPINAGCLSLYYNMNGEGLGALEIKAITERGTNILWHKNGDQGTDWHRAVIPILLEVKELVISGEVGATFTGDIAIDDISFIQGACATDKKVVKRLEFEAEYNADCSVINDVVGRAILLSSAGKHADLLKYLCSKDCTISDSMQPEVACNKDNGNILIRWATTTTYPADAATVPADLMTLLSKKITAQGTKELDIVISNGIPPVVYPLRTSVKLQPFCTNGGVFNSNTDKCE